MAHFAFTGSGVKKTPLQRKTSLRESYAAKMRAKMAAGASGGRSASFKAPKAPKQRKPMKKVSDKQKAENVLYEKAKREWRNEHDGRCEMALLGDNPIHRGSLNPANGKRPISDRCTRQAMNQPHHLRKRLGGNLYDKSTFIGLCFECHTWVHDNEKRARELGWLEA